MSFASGDTPSPLVRGVLRNVVVISAWLIAVTLAITAWQTVWGYGSAVGLDFDPIWLSAQALIHGHSIYSVTGTGEYVYLPTTTLLVLPLIGLSEHHALQLFVIADMVALAGALAIAVWPLGAPWRRYAMPLLIAVMFGSDLTRDTLYAANASMLIAPLAVGALLSFEHRRWRLGCALVVISFFVKPLLIPLLLIPVLRRRFLDVTLTLVPAILAVVILALTLPGGTHLSGVISNVVHPPSLVASSPRIVHNIALEALGLHFGWQPFFAGARVVLALATVAMIVLWTRRGDAPGETAALGVVLLLTLLLVGSLGERNYFFVIAPCMLLAVARRRSLLTSLAPIAAALVLFLPRQFFGGIYGSNSALQLRYALAAVFLFGAALTFFSRSRTDRSRERPRDLASTSTTS